MAVYIYRDTVERRGLNQLDTEPVFKGEDVLVLTSAAAELHAVKATKKRPAHIKLNLEYILPESLGMPVDDVSWFVDNAHCLLLVGVKAGIIPPVEEPQ